MKKGKVFLFLCILILSCTAQLVWAETEPEFQIFQRLKLFEREPDGSLGPIDLRNEASWSNGARLEPRISLEEIADRVTSAVHFKTHVVQRGETLWGIAQQYGVDVATLAGVNHDLANVHNIKVGDEIRVINIIGTIHVVEEGDTLESIAQEYGVSPDEIQRVNTEDLSTLEEGQEVIVPGARPPDFAQRGGTLDSFVWPVSGGRISSHFGPRWGGFHEGLDIAVPTGTPVRASKEGWVTFSGWNGGYGNVIDIDHGGQVVTRYAHNSRLLVSRGSFVHQGQVIAYSGNTGTSTGPHLHFEIRLDGRPQNPIRYLPSR